METAIIMKHFKNFIVRGGLVILLVLGLSHNVIAGGDWAVVDRPEVEREVYWIEPIRQKPIYLMPDFEIIHVVREYDVSNPDQDFYRYDITIRNRGGYCNGSQGGIGIEGVFTRYYDHCVDYKKHCYERVDPPAEWGDEVMVQLWEPIDESDDPNNWITEIEIDYEGRYIESDESNNEWIIDHSSCPDLD